MLNKMIRWFMSFYYRRKILKLLAEYEAISKSNNRTDYLGLLFDHQVVLLNSGIFNDLYINALPSSSVFIYYDLEETLKKFEEFASQVERNGIMDGNTLGDFRLNSKAITIHQAFKGDVSVGEQLIQMSELLRRLLIAHSKGSPSIRTVNLSRIIVPFEMFSIMLDRIARGYLEIK